MFCFLNGFEYRGYMDANNHRVYSVRSDIFSFGMTLLEIITAQSTRELQNNENYDVSTYSE
jgi:hypothetical protein